MRKKYTIKPGLPFEKALAYVIERRQFRLEAGKPFDRRHVLNELQARAASGGFSRPSRELIDNIYIECLDRGLL